MKQPRAPTEFARPTFFKNRQELANMLMFRGAERGSSKGSVLTNKSSKQLVKGDILEDPMSNLLNAPEAPDASPFRYSVDSSKSTTAGSKRSLAGKQSKTLDTHDFDVVPLYDNGDETAGLLEEGNVYSCVDVE